MMLKALIATYGCQMNKHDSEIIGGLLRKIGYEIYYDYEILKTEIPDLILLNTCAVRNNAEQRVLGRLGELKKYKDKKKDLIMIISGCVAQEHGKELLKKRKYLDLVIGPSDIHNIDKIVTKLMEDKKQFSYIDTEKRVLTFESPHYRNNKFQAWVSIISGCNNFCSYCIVPYVRKREVSRKSEDIIKEIDGLVKTGYKEIVLLDQNVNSYGNDLQEKIRFPDLLQKICEKYKDIWIRFVTSHPKDLSYDLICIIKKYPQICNHLHLPVQSGSDKILKLMNRKYSREHYMNLIEELRKNIPDIVITTDVIIGFPGETEEDYNETVDLFEKIKYDSAFIFKYSDRTGTKSEKMEDKISSKIISRRHTNLLKFQTKIAANQNLKHIGKKYKVLVESISPKDKTYLSGRSQYNNIIIFKGDKNLIGTFVDVKIISAKSWTLWGEVVEG